MKKSGRESDLTKTHFFFFATVGNISALAKGVSNISNQNSRIQGSFLTVNAAELDSSSSWLFTEKVIIKHFW